MLVTCIKPFQDLEENVWREQGDAWEATPERLRAINTAGYGIMAEEVADEPPEEEADALDSLTVRELTAMCDEMGIDYPAKPKKAELVEAIEAAREAE